MTVHTCLLCGFPLFEAAPRAGLRVSCPVCGDYVLNAQTQAKLTAPDRSLAFSHIARWLGHLDNSTLPPAGSGVHFPDDVTRLDNLVYYMGAHPGTPASAMQNRLLPAWQAIIGAPAPEEARRTIAQGEQVALLTAAHVEGATGLALTFDGWERYRAFKRAAENPAALIVLPSSSMALLMLVDRSVRPVLEELGYASHVYNMPGDGADLQVIALLRAAALLIMDVSGTEDRPPWPTAIAHAMDKPVLHLRNAHSEGHLCQPENCLCGAPAIEWDMASPEGTTARVAAALRAISVAAPITPARP